jgi:hypothetical protein
VECYSSIILVGGQRGREILYLHEKLALDGNYHMNADLRSVEDEVVSLLYAAENSTPGMMLLSKIGGTLSTNAHDCILAYRLQLKSFLRLVGTFSVSCVEHGCEVVCVANADDLEDEEVEDDQTSDVEIDAAPQILIGEQGGKPTSSKMRAFKASMPQPFKHPRDIDDKPSMAYIAVSPPSPVSFIATPAETVYPSPMFCAQGSFGSHPSSRSPNTMQYRRSVATGIVGEA